MYLLTRLEKRCQTEGESYVHSILSDMPSSLIFAFSGLLNSPFSEVDITYGEASIYLFSGAGTHVLELYQVLVYLGIHSSIDCSATKLWPLLSCRTLQRPKLERIKTRNNSLCILINKQTRLLELARRSRLGHNFLCRLIDVQARSKNSRNT